MCNAERRIALQDPRDFGPAEALAGPGIRVEAMPLQGHVLVQLPPGATREQLRERCALPLPERAGSALGENPAMLWVGPRAWVVIAAQADVAASLAVQLAAALRDIGGHAVDLSDAHQSLRISGAASVSLLAQGCMLDLDAAFPMGSATRTALARMPVILHRRDPDAWWLHVDRSLAHQLWRWLQLGVDEISALAPFEAQGGAR